jgi:hypothetical protein
MAFKYIKKLIHRLHFTFTNPKSIYNQLTNHKAPKAYVAIARALLVILLIFIFAQFVFGIIYYYFLSYKDFNLKPKDYTLFNTFYYAMITGTNTGYGDIVPTSYKSKLFSMIQTIISFFTMTFAIAIVTFNNSKFIIWLDNHFKLGKTKN